MPPEAARTTLLSSTSGKLSPTIPHIHPALHKVKRVEASD
jgi:hypothetical protein